EFGDLSLPIVSGLVNSLTNVTSLEIAINDVSCQALNYVCFLLTAWAGTLTSLKISADFREQLPNYYNQSMIDDYTSYQVCNTVRGCAAQTLLYWDPFSLKVVWLSRSNWIQLLQLFYQSCPIVSN